MLPFYVDDYFTYHNLAMFLVCAMSWLDQQVAAVIGVYGLDLSCWYQLHLFTKTTPFVSYINQMLGEI